MRNIKIIAIVFMSLYITLGVWAIITYVHMALCHPSLTNIELLLNWWNAFTLQEPNIEVKNK